MADGHAVSEHEDVGPNAVCSFCQKTRREVALLIAGPKVYICDECIGLCNEIVDTRLSEPGVVDACCVPNDGATEYGAHTAGSHNEAVLAAVLRMLSAGKEILAIDAIVAHLDTLFMIGDWTAARKMLAMLDASKLPPKMISGVLLVTAHARVHLGDARVEFVVRAWRALADTWQLSPEAFSRIMTRLE